MCVPIRLYLQRQAVGWTKQTVSTSKERQGENSSAMFVLRSESEKRQGSPETVNTGLPSIYVLVTITEFKKHTPINQKTQNLVVVKHKQNLVQ